MIQVRTGGLRALKYKVQLPPDLLKFNKLHPGFMEIHLRVYWRNTYEN